MLMCCDAINLVKKASRDLKVKRSLSRKRRVQTVVGASDRGAYSTLDAKGTQKDFDYERSSVSKLDKVRERSDERARMNVTEPNNFVRPLSAKKDSK